VYNVYIHINLGRYFFGAVLHRNIECTECNIIILVFRNV